MSSARGSSPSLVQRVDVAFGLLVSGLCEAYGLLRSDRRAKPLLGDVAALHKRCTLEERLLRSRLGMASRAAPELPGGPIHAAELGAVCKQTLDGPIAASRELEDYFSFFKLANVAEFYHKVRFELLDLQRASQQMLAEPAVPDLPRRSREGVAAPKVIVAGRVRQALAACPLYFILDSSLCQFRDPVKLGFEAVAAGVRMLQLRLEQASTREFIDVAQRLKQMCGERDCILIINDRLDVALLSGAHGIHVGADDPTVGEVRRLAPQLLVGVTARKTKTALEAQQAGADYLGCGSVFASPTKPGLPLLGTRGIRRIVSNVGIPVVGIGGITLENAGEVLEAGAAGVCSIAPFRQLRSTRNLIGQFRQLREQGAGGER